MEIKLVKSRQFVIKPTAPYNFDATLFKPSHYPDPLKVYEPGKYWFAMRFEDKIFGVKLVNCGSIDDPKVNLKLFYKERLSSQKLKSLLDELKFRCEFDVDLSEFYDKFANDRVLSPFLRRWRGMHESHTLDLYGLLMICIFLQNTVIRRTVQMTRAMLEKYGTLVKFDGREVFVFWTPEQLAKVSEEELRKLKVGYRAKLFIKSSRSWIAERINEFELRKLQTNEARKRLLRIYGVGPETARILLTEGLGKYDIFDHVAPWQQKILSRLLFNKPLVPASKIIEYANKRWDKWVALAVHYIWEDIFWRHARGEKIEWLDKEIRL